jgi:hypothetical protein
MKKALKLLLFTIAVPIFACIHSKISYAGTYSLNMNAYTDAFKSEKIKVAICAKDNVGNKAILRQDVLDLFTLKARIVPSNNRGYNSELPPTLKEGQEGVLIMETTGEAESLEIEFKELDEMDNTLDKTIEINPRQIYNSTEDKFIVPLYCKDKTYEVRVTAYRDGSTREVYPEFIVSDSVLNGIKTRIKN